MSGTSAVTAVINAQSGNSLARELLECGTLYQKAVIRFAIDILP